MSSEDIVHTTSTRRSGRAAAAKAIILGAHYGGLSVVRALGQEGLECVVVTSNPRDHACRSKFVSDLVITPDPATHEQELVDILMNTQKDWAGAFLIPTLDEYVVFVSQNRQRLGQRFIFSVQDPNIVGRIINKNLLYPEAVKHGVAVPRFFLPQSLDDLNEHEREYPFPCILKPFESRRFSETYGAKVLVAKDFEDLAQKYADTQRHGLSVMICEIIPGDDSSIFTYRCYIDSQGDLLAEMYTQKVRQYPPGFGQGSVQRTIPPIPVIRDQGLRLLRGFDYRGQSSTEFRLDCRDNQYKLMETNIRPGVADWLLVKAGMNFPYMTYLDLVENVRRRQTDYMLDLYWIHNHWEPVNFIASLGAGNLKPVEFFAPYVKKKVFVVPFFEDPQNYLVELIQNMARLWKKRRHHVLWK